MKRRLFLGLLAISLFSQATGGCWSRKELNQISLVIAAAIDQGPGPDQVTFSIQVVNPSSIEKNTETEKSLIIAEGTGFTLADAERNLYKRVSRPIFWQHMRALIISEQLAKTNFGAILDYLDRALAFRDRVLLLVTPGQARDVLGVASPVDRFSGQAIYNLARETFKHSKAFYPSNITTFLINLTTPGIEPVLARLIHKQSDPLEQKTAAGILELSGCAVFKGDRMIGWLNEMETTGFAFIQSKVQNTTLVIPYPRSHNRQGLISIINLRSTCRIEPRFRSGQAMVTLRVKAEGRISGQSFAGKDFTQPSLLQALERKYALAIKHQIIVALAKAQGEYDADIFGFGLAFSRKYPSFWKKAGTSWDLQYKRLIVVPEVTAHIRRMGLTLKPIESR